MAKANLGDVLTGAARPEDVISFGGEQAHKAFALAVGLQLLVDALAGPPGGYGGAAAGRPARARPRARAAGVRSGRAAAWRRPGLGVMGSGAAPVAAPSAVPRAPAAKECSERWRTGRT